MNTQMVKAVAWLAVVTLIAFASALWWHWGPAIFVAGLGGWIC